MNLRQAYEYGRGKLNDAGIEEADLDAWYLLEFVTGIDRAGYYLKMQEEVSDEQEVRYKKYIDIRASRIPLQHITGVQEFMGLTFCVNEHVLVPRQDTEVLVESVLQVLQPEMKVLDMCTGSGCILISLMKHCQGLIGVGVDISEEALKVASQNCERLSVKLELLRSDLFEKVEGKYDVIVSNPPYIRTEVIRELQEEVRCHEPFIALDGKEDGLYFYRKIVGNSTAHLNDGGKLYFEIGHDQGEDVKMLMEQAGFKNVQVKKDLAGLDRVVFGKYN